ncbi:MAG: S-layer homology domain-containing protein [Aquificaceae bacterium]
MKKLITLSLFFAIAYLFSCAPKQTAKCPAGESEQQYVLGMTALEKEDVNTAIEKFNRASFCDEKSSKANSGMAIAHAIKASQQKDPGFRQVEAKRVEDYLEKAKKQISSPEDEFDYKLAIIRSYTYIQPKDWLEKAEDAYKDAKKLKVDERKLSYYQGKESADYFMGLAYMSAYEFAKARDRFQAVLSAKRDSKWHEPADRAWKRVDKIVRALGGISVGDVAKRIAVKDSVSRADLTALLVIEVKVDKLFAGRIPVQSQVEKMQAEFVPADILNHPFKNEIITILKWKVRGLEPMYDQTTKAYLFKPDNLVTRGEMALILEDVLIKLTGDESIARAYLGHERSPFPDIRPTSPIYNAVMSVTTRGLMEPELSGEFRADKPVDGAEAILAIRVLKQRMNIQ